MGAEDIHSLKLLFLYSLFILSLSLYVFYIVYRGGVT